MKRSELLRRLTAVAAGKGLPFVFKRHGAKHDIYVMGSTPFSIPRHPDINEITARKELKKAGEL